MATWENQDFCHLLSYPRLLVSHREPFVKYQLSRRLCDRSNRSTIAIARAPSGLLPASALPLLRSAVRVGQLLGTKPGSRVTQSATRRANERIPCETCVRRDRCVRSNLLEACPCTCRSHTRVAQLQRGLHAPQGSCDLCRIGTAASWRST